MNRENRMIRLILTAIAVCALFGAIPHAATAQSAADSAAIRAAALDYIHGWYSGDADRMAKSLHPELAKRIVEKAQNGGDRLGNMGADQLIGATRTRNGGTMGRSDVEILTVFGNTAAVRVDADDWVDLMHLARWNGEWKIVNVLWEFRRR